MTPTAKGRNSGDRARQACTICAPQRGTRGWFFTSRKAHWYAMCGVAAPAPIAALCRASGVFTKAKGSEPWRIT